jgi:hypothetical protein
MVITTKTLSGKESFISRKYGLVHLLFFDFDFVFSFSYPNSVNVDLNSDSDVYKELLEYRSVSSLDYERLEEGHPFLAGKRCLSDWCQLK